MKKIIPLILIAALATSYSALAQNSKPHINHLAIFVVDMKKSNHFYIDILGLDTIPEPFHDNKHTWLAIGPGSSLHIIEGAKAKIEHFKNNHLCFSVGSVEKFTDLLKKNNVTFEDISGKKNVFSVRPDGVKQIWLQDPDGYWVEINDAKD